jgi:hypothetical protein
MTTDSKNIKYIILFDQKYQKIESENKAIFDEIKSITGETGNKGRIQELKAKFESTPDPNKTKWDSRTQVQYLIKKNPEGDGFVVYEPKQNVNNIYELFLYKDTQKNQFNYDVFKNINLTPGLLLKVNYDNNETIPIGEIDNQNYFYHIYLNYVTDKLSQPFENLYPDQKKYFVIKTTNYDNVIIEITDKKIPNSKYNNLNVFFHYVQIRIGNNNPDIVTVKFDSFNTPIYNSIYTATSPIPVKTTKQIKQEEYDRLSSDYS